VNNKSRREKPLYYRLYLLEDDPYVPDGKLMSATSRKKLTDVQFKTQYEDNKNSRRPDGTPIRIVDDVRNPPPLSQSVVDNAAVQPILDKAASSIREVAKPVLDNASETIRDLSKTAIDEVLAVHPTIVEPIQYDQSKKETNPIFEMKPLDLSEQGAAPPFLDNVPSVEAESSSNEEPSEQSSEEPSEEPSPCGQPTEQGGCRGDGSPPAFLYPHLDDPDFSLKIAQRQELASTKYDGTIYDIKKQANFLCAAEFELMPHQLFVRNFLSFQTPYNSLLLYHGLGTGKTCTAIGVAEEMRAYMKQTGLKKTVLIIASPNVQDNFMNQLFDERKLKQEGGVWNIHSCVGAELLNEINPTSFKSMTRETIAIQIKSIIKQYYTFMGYTAFANYITEMTEIKGIGFSKKERDRIRTKNIHEVFDNRLIIVDEVHNIRITDENKNRKTAELLMNIARDGDNVRLLLLSATPMYNSHEEIVWLCNLMNVNDKRDPLKISDVFDAATRDFKEGGKELLQRKLTGYVSYVRGENPYTFPYRIYPPADPTFKYPTKQMNGKPIDAPLERVPIYPTNIGEYQAKGYKAIVDHVASADLPTFEEMNTFGYTVLQMPVEALNIVYPADTAEEMTGKQGLDFIMTHKAVQSDTPQRYDFQYKNPAPEARIFSPAEIGKYSAKIAKICEIIRQSEGVIMVYSQYIDGGAVPMALALEEMGFTRFGSEPYTKSLLKTRPEPIDAITMKPKSEVPSGFSAARYVMITGDKTFSPNNDADLKYLNAPENCDGKKVKVVLISKAAGEGIDFKNIRQIHIMEPWYNMNRTEQIIGRGVRNLSHCALPFEKRNVEIFMHATVLAAEEEPADLYIYRLAERKSVEIGRVSRVVKQVAVDCFLNLGQMNMGVEELMTMAENQKIELELALPRDGKRTFPYKIGDRPYSNVCDYMEDCKFACLPKMADGPMITATYDETFAQMNNPRIIQRIRDLFRDARTFIAREELINSINIVREYPIDQINSALTQMIENRDEFLLDRYGRLGRLTNSGDIYMFQPISITDDAASIFDRSVPADIRPKSVILEKPKDTEKADSASFAEIYAILTEQWARAKTETVVAPGEKDWYKIFGSLTSKFADFVPNADLDKCLGFHMMDEIRFDDKLTILAEIYGAEWVAKTRLDVLMKDYFETKMIKQDATHYGIVLSRNHKTAKEIYEMGDDGKWREAEYVETMNYIRAPDFRAKYAVPSTGELIGFMSWNETMGKYLFKIRKQSDKVNLKGARVDQAENKNIISYINDVLGTKYEKDEPTMKSLDGKQKLAVILEVILRTVDDERRAGKRWFISNEQMLISQTLKN
jgi:hypothetical protein